MVNYYGLPFAAFCGKCSYFFEISHTIKYFSVYVLFIIRDDETPTRAKNGPSSDVNAAIRHAIRFNVTIGNFFFINAGQSVRIIIMCVCVKLA